MCELIPVAFAGSEVGLALLALLASRDLLKS